ncbi:MAG: RluA family pseudouridine synthase [Limosilactobacillus sp.]|jgi:23S rRNA pseudouridine1911/1915/1917 synthase|uniref:RluA family pseudouridine synthase n=1 Tax=Limosilactobacillus sp. TaxID=2773925 RepID=UPI0025C49023|nr:RluA family pseudouridine synthase [Limosilactobacillus sp.]MCI1974373.1 RluA family pseudouridine synthase [Limosilactobacillus sp.]MCI2030560.1 RluA family pseudouridine synthase [Limosilactobacillus sp.]
MADYQWQLREQLVADQPVVSIRELLQRQWLLPKRFVHYLRSRRQVLINGEYQSMNTLIHSGDQVTLQFRGDEFRQSDANQYLPTATPHLNVLYENRDLVVVNKPRGQKSHPNEKGETGTLMNDVAGYLHHQAYMVHRIDQQTSGAVIVAKNPIVVPILDRLISRGQIHREYLAIVTGRLTGSGEWNWPIGDDPTDPWRRMVNGEAAQPAQTFYQTLAATEQASLVRLKLGTGRTHQLRVHLAHSGHPIIGDPIYNPGSGEGMLLHGQRQRLVLPFSNEQLEIIAPVPTYFERDLVKYHLE